MMQNYEKYYTIQLNTTKITNIAPKYTPKYHKTSKTPTNHIKNLKILQNVTKYLSIPQNTQHCPKIAPKYHKSTQNTTNYTKIPQINIK